MAKPPVAIVVPDPLIAPPVRVVTPVTETVPAVNMPPLWLSVVMVVLPKAGLPSTSSVPPVCVTTPSLAGLREGRRAGGLRQRSDRSSALERHGRTVVDDGRTRGGGRPGER